MIRKIYGHEISREDYRLRAPDTPGWHYWRELIKVAVKFREPKLADNAEFELFAYGNQLCSSGCIDGVCDILEAMHEMEERPKMLRRIVYIVRKAKGHTRSNKRFHAYLLYNPEVMMELIEGAASRLYAP